MLAISRALMGRPKLLLLDEPSLGLSPLLVQQIFGIIRRINRGTERRHPAGRAERPYRAADRGLSATCWRSGGSSRPTTAQTLMQRDDIKEFYLGQKETGARGTRRWKKKRLWN